MSVSTGVYSIDLIQPDSMAVQPGQSLTITCRVSGYSLTSYGTCWIRQHAGKAMGWILCIWTDGSNSKNDALKTKFSYSRDTSAGTVIITGQNLQPEDKVVYYCAREVSVSHFRMSYVYNLISFQVNKVERFHHYIPVVTIL
uniref:Ig-like domain-containing protein n=1 Tax=Amphilophus citrinellus TaxID=61819 RepID=A0A3Q0T7U8_AMPCI